jgi:hypothetical protein
VTDTALEQSLPANAQFCSVKVIDFGFCEEVQPGQLLERFSGSEAYVAPGEFLFFSLSPLLA